MQWLLLLIRRNYALLIYWKAFKRLGAIQVLVDKARAVDQGFVLVRAFHQIEVTLGSCLPINLGTLEPIPPLIGYALLGRQCTPCLCYLLGTLHFVLNPAMMAILSSPLLANANSSVITIRH